MRIIGVALIVLVTGCATMLAPRLEVPLELGGVQRPADVAERWGSYTLAPADTSGYTYEDGLLALAVVPLRGSFSVLLENRTEHSIRLLWAESSYVGPDGLSSGVVPGETRWIDMGNVPSPQVIPAQASAAFTAIPRATANVSATTITPFYPSRTTCEEAEESTIRLILPLEIEGNLNEYTLVFEPRGEEIAIVREQRDPLAGITTEVSREPC